MLVVSVTTSNSATMMKLVTCLEVSIEIHSLTHKRTWSINYASFPTLWFWHIFHAAGVKIGSNSCLGKKACCGVTTEWLNAEFNWTGELSIYSALTSSYPATVSLPLLNPLQMVSLIINALFLGSAALR